MKRLTYLLITVSLVVSDEVNSQGGLNLTIQQWISSNGLEEAVANRDLNEKDLAGFVREAQTTLAAACGSSEAGKRACDFESNLRVYTNYINADQTL